MSIEAKLHSMNHGLHCHHVKHWVRVLSVKRHLAYIQLQGESFFAPISHKHRKRWSTTTKYILSNHRTFWHIGRMVYCYLIFLKSFLMMCSQMLSRVLWFDPAFFGTKQFCSRMFLIGLRKIQVTLILSLFFTDTRVFYIWQNKNHRI